MTRPTVVLLHGVGLDHTMWDPVVALLAGDVDVVTPDLPGHGARPPAPAGVTLADLADGVAADIPPGSHLVGFSLGALVAQHLALYRPALVATLTSVSSVCRRTAEERAAVLDRLRTAERDFAASAAASLRRWYDGTEVDPEQVRRTEATLLANDRDSFLHCYRVFATADAELGPELDRITVPALADHRRMRPRVDTRDDPAAGRTHCPTAERSSCPAPATCSPSNGRGSSSIACPPSSERTHMSDQTKLQHFIGGEWVAPTSGEYFESTNPATREVLYHAARGNAADVSAAVDSAQATFEDPRWRDLSQTRRGHLLRRLGDLIGEHAEEFARSESQDNGKLLREMRGQLKTLPEYYYYYAGLADKIHGAVVPTSDRKVLNYTSREPLGVVGAITPWNSPLTLTTSKLAPALCVGNTVVIKPSEYTSATVLRLAELVIEAGFPPGAVNIVTGFGVEAGQAAGRSPCPGQDLVHRQHGHGRAHRVFSGRPVHRVHPGTRRQIAQHRVRGRQYRERRDGCGGGDLRRRGTDLHRRQPGVRTSGGLRRAARAGDGTGPQHPHR